MEKKKLHPLLVVVIVLLLLAMTLCGVVLGLWLHGRSAMNEPTEGPNLPEQEEQTEKTGSFVEYNGKRYQYNEDMKNILLMGIDSDKNPDEAAGSHDQADVFVLAAMDLNQNKMTLISLSRDIMCNIPIEDNDNQQIGLKKTQLALAYAYGDGRHGSCKIARDAVSNIFYGLPIQGYGAYYLNGVADLNDAVGGVTVNLIFDYPFYVCDGAKRLTEDLEGKDVTLTGKEAAAYIRARDENRPDANGLRMQRQKQYMLALISKAKDSAMKNPASIMEMYGAVDDYILTNLGLSEISYLATQAIGMDFAGDIRNVSGEVILNEENMAEIHVNQQELYELMLDVFYMEVE